MKDHWVWDKGLEGVVVAVRDEHAHVVGPWQKSRDVAACPTVAAATQTHGAVGLGDSTPVGAIPSYRQNFFTGLGRGVGRRRDQGADYTHKTIHR